MKILLTGHNGFIGRNLYEKYSDLIVLEKDFLNENDWEKKLAGYVEEVDIIFHIGAISDTSFTDVGDMMKYNYYFSKVLFDYAAIKDTKVIYSSSAAIYGTKKTKYLPANLYAWSKMMAEDYGMQRCNNFVALRYFNVYGPGEGDKDKMASVVRQAWKTTDFKLFPKNPKRDFVYIKDVVDANIHAINVPKGIYDVGTGAARTFEDMFDGMGIKYSYHPVESIPAWYQYHTEANKDKFMPGWKPKYPLERGINDYKNYLEEKK